MDTPETIGLKNNENYTPEEAQNNQRKKKKRSARQMERARKYREQFYAKPEKNVIPDNNPLPYEMHKPIGLAECKESLHVNETEFDNGMRKHAEKKNRNRSAKQVERARKWRELKYGYDCILENTDQVRPNRMNSKAIDPTSTLEHQNDIEGTCEPESMKRQLNTKLRATAAEFIPCGETWTLSQGNNSVYVDYGIQGILAIYINSGLHGELDSTMQTVQSDEKTSTDSEHFGYEYFSLSNL